MNNADMPAMPVVNSDGLAVYPLSGAVDHGSCSGLTKREHYAGLALMGLISAWGQHNVTDAKEIVEDAVSFADALLAELGREAT